MKSNSVLVAITLLALCLFGGQAHAAPVFFSWGGEKIIKVLPLPDTPDFKSKEGAHIDVGYRFKQITIFFIPAWNYDEYWCGYIENGNRYIDFDKKTLDDGAAQASMIIPSGSPIPFWDAYGGKLLLLLIVFVFYGYGKVFKKKDALSGPSESVTDNLVKDSQTTMIASNISKLESVPNTVHPSAEFGKSPMLRSQNDFQDTSPQMIDAKAPSLSDSVLNSIYSHVAKEISENKFDPGLLARSNVESKGDEQAKLRIYTEHRVKQYIEAHHKRNTTNR
jgi:hypothetical protein